MKNKLLIVLLTTPLLVANNNDFESWQQQEVEEFQSFQSNEDRAFMKHLQEWEWYKQGKSPMLYDKPKPTTQSTKMPLSTQKIPLIIKKLKPISQNLPTVVQPSVPMDYQLVNIDFFGKNLSFSFPQRMNFTLTKVSTVGISKFWQQITQQEYQVIVDRITIYQEKYQLNGWATYLLIDKLSREISQNYDIQRLIRWFFLLKIGIDAKVGISQKQVVLMVHSSHLIYASRYFFINHKRYFVLENFLPTTQLQIYKGGESNLLALEFMGQPHLKQALKSKILQFTFQEQTYKIPFYYNQNLIDFYQTYPQIPYNYYTTMSLSSQSKHSLKKVIQPIVEPMNQLDTINFLLRLTQNGFKYKRDHAQFGKEKVMFFEETLAYPYSDCEDRAIFFSHLVKELLELEMVLIKYPNHLATAIALDSNIKGESVIYKNKKYYIADPTYGGSNIGQAMPQLEGQKIKIIEP
jgi:hypothetical protein